MASANTAGDIYKLFFYTNNLKRTYFIIQYKIVNISKTLFLKLPFFLLLRPFFHSLYKDKEVVNTNRLTKQPTNKELYADLYLSYAL